MRVEWLGVRGLRGQIGRQALESAALAGLCLTLALAMSKNGQVGFALVALILGLAALAAPAASWALAALIAALTFRGLVTLGLLPSVATFLDIPLAWGALVVALLKRPSRSRLASSHLRWLGALALAVGAAWLFNRSEPLRPILYLALIGEPFALLGALLLEPPSAQMRRVLLRTLVALVLIQVPFAVWQGVSIGLADHIQGTLYGAGAGAHVMSGVVAIGAIWVLIRRGEGFSLRRLPLACGLLAIPFFADAKQVILALPVGILAANVRRWGASVALPIGLVAVAISAFVYLYPSGNFALRVLGQASSGNDGKTLVVKAIWHEVGGDPTSLAFGKGPAETVSRAAFLTTPQGDEHAPLKVFHLRPARIAVDIEARSFAQFHGGTSFNSGLSSAFGVLGDLGLVGTAVYVGLFGNIFLAVRRRPSAEAFAAAVGWTMFGLLGFVFDWWEQPPLSLFLAVLSGLALTEALPERGRRASRPHPAGAAEAVAR